MMQPECVIKHGIACMPCMHADDEVAEGDGRSFRIPTSLKQRLAVLLDMAHADWQTLHKAFDRYRNQPNT